MKLWYTQLDHAVIVREALPGELAEVGEIRVNAYRAGGHMSPESAYAPVLRALGSAGDGTVLVAVAGLGDDGDQGRGADQGNDRQDQVNEADQGNGTILGTIMLQRGQDGGQLVSDEHEAEIRALAVAPQGQGKGTGSALLRAAIEQAERAGVRNLVLLTQADMRAAQHLYQKAGFRRLPDRDWSPRPGITLLAYGLPLNAALDNLRAPPERGG
jgi:ribosomal protein S18 acetylase RimI-like enzyme